MSTPESNAQQGVAAAPADERPSANRRGRLIALVLLILAAGGLWLASRMTWAHVLTIDGLSPARTFEVKGSDWSLWLTPLGIALLAAGGVMFALHGWAVRAVAILVAAGGVAAAIPAISLLADGEGNLYAARVAEVPDRYEVIGVSAEALPGVVLLVAAVLAVLGAIAMMRTARAGGMSSKYSSPAARREELERQVFAERERRAVREEAGEDDADAPGDGNERLLWDSLDNGIDPTDDRR